MRSIMGINLAWFNGKNIMRSIMRVNLAWFNGKKFLLGIENRTEFTLENLWRNSVSNLAWKLYLLGQVAALQNNQPLGKGAATYSSKSLFARKQVALLGQCLSTCLVTLKGSSHLQILQPLVAN